MGLPHEAIEELRRVFARVSRDNPTALHAGDQMTASLRRMLRNMDLDPYDEDVLAAMFVAALFIKTVRQSGEARPLLRVAGDAETALLFALASTVRQQAGEFTSGRATPSPSRRGPVRVRGHEGRAPRQLTFGPRLVEVPGLADVGEHLRSLGLDDVRIRPVTLLDGSVAWLAMVFLGSPPGVHPWVMGLRPSREEAQAAVETMLRALAEGRARGVDEHPYIHDADADTMARRHEVASATTQEWAEARGSNATAMRLFGVRVGLARARLGWSQQELADRLGVRHHDVAQIERGLFVPDGELLDQLTELLDMPGPSGPRRRDNP